MPSIGQRLRRCKLLHGQMGRREVGIFCDVAATVVRRCREMDGDAFELVENLDEVGRHAYVELFAAQSVGCRVQVVAALDVTVGVKLQLLPLADFVGSGRQL